MSLKPSGGGFRFDDGRIAGMVFYRSFLSKFLKLNSREDVEGSIKLRRNNVRM